MGVAVLLPACYGISLITLIGIFLLLPHIEREEKSSVKASLRGLHTHVWLILSVSIIATIGGFATYTYIAPILHKITALQNISWFLLLFGIGSLFGNLLGGYGTDRIGAAKTLLMSLGGFSIILISFSLLPLLTPGLMTIVLVSVIALLWGIPGFALNPAINSYLISLNPNQASLVLSFSASALYVGIGLGAIVGGAVIRLSSIDFVGLISGILVGIALAILVVQTRLHRRS